MRRLLTGALAAVLPALLVSAMIVGCSGKDNTGGEKKDNTGHTPKPPVKKEELASKGWGTFKGKVTFAGDPKSINIKAMDEALKELMKANTQDGAFCLSGPPEEVNEQQWEFGKDNGVGNVFVWLEPVDDKHYFKIDWDKKPWAKEVDIDQPHCAFKPHARPFFRGAYPDGDDSKDLKESGQKLLVKNSAPINHNTHWSGEGQQGGSQVITAKSANPLDLTTNLMPSSEPVTINCDIHKWMTGVIRVFDHPYAAVTDKDGKFEIPHAPAGVELRVFVWHESADNPKTGKEVGKVTLEDDKTIDKDYTVSAGK